MKLCTYIRSATAFAMALPLTIAFAASSAPKSDFSNNAAIASQGSSVVTLADIDRYVEAKIPEKDRAGVFHSGDRILLIVGNVLLAKQLAAEARELGIDKDPLAADQLKDGDPDETLARLRMERFAQQLAPPDFTELAHERYQLDPSKYDVSSRTDIRQVVISTNARDEDAAGKIADKVYAEAVGNPGSFEQLIQKYSDDPNKAETKGVMEDMEDPKYRTVLRDAALALKEPGDISEPVRTPSGFQILQLVKHTPAKHRSFEEVRDEMTAKMREQWIAKQKQDHIDELRNMPVYDVNEDLLLSLQTRYDNSADQPAPTPAASD